MFYWLLLGVELWCSGYSHERFGDGYRWDVLNLGVWIASQSPSFVVRFLKAAKKSRKNDTKKRSKRWNTKITYAENIITYILETPFYAGKFWVKWWLGLAARIFMGAHPQVPSLMWKPGDPWMLTYPYRLFLHTPIMIPTKELHPHLLVVIWVISRLISTGVATLPCCSFKTWNPVPSH